MTINLYTTFYEEPNPERKQELLYCIKKNAECRSVDSLFILNEARNPPLIQSDKIHYITITNRPTYNDFFKFINEKTADENINIIANTDIYFDTSLDKLKELNLKNHCLALTRWEINMENNTLELPADSYYCQDSWVFKGCIQNINGDIKLGMPGCDNRIAYEIKKAGYRISNLSISIKSYHVHGVQIHNYSEGVKDTVSGSYAFCTSGQDWISIRRVIFL